MNKILRALVTVVLLSIIAWRMNWQQVGNTFANLQVAWWLLAVALLAVTQVVSAWRWQVIARPLGLERSLWQLTGFYYIGMYFNLLLPTSVGGDVVRAWYLDGHSGHRLQAFVAVFLDRLSGLLVLLAMACVAVVFSPLALEPWILWFVYGTAACAVVGLSTAPLLARHSERAAARLHRLRGAWAALRSPRVLIVSTLLSLFVQAANVVLVWFVGIAIGAEVPFTFYWILVPMVSLLTLLPISTGGAGVREFSTGLFLAPLGVSEEMAVSLAFLWFAVYTTTSLAGGVVYLFGRFPKPETPALTQEPGKEEADHGPIDRDSDQGRERQFGAAA